MRSLTVHLLRLTNVAQSWDFALKAFLSKKEKQSARHFRGNLAHGKKAKWPKLRDETGLRAVKCMQCEAIVCDPGTISTNSNFNGVCFSFGGIVCLLRVLRLWSLLSMPAQCTHWCEKQWNYAAHRYVLYPYMVMPLSLTYFLSLSCSSCASAPNTPPPPPLCNCNDAQMVWHKHKARPGK